MTPRGGNFCVIALTWADAGRRYRRYRRALADLRGNGHGQNLAPAAREAPWAR